MDSNSWSCRVQKLLTIAHFPSPHAGFMGSSVPVLWLITDGQHSRAQLINTEGVWLCCSDISLRMLFFSWEIIPHLIFVITKWKSFSLHWGLSRNQGALFHPKDNVHMLIKTINIIIVISVSFLGWLDSLQEPSVLLCEALKRIIGYPVKTAD